MKPFLHAVTRRRRRALLGGVALVTVASLAAVSAAFAGGARQEAAALLIGESSPVASNPNQQAITYGEVQAAKHYGWKVKTLDANLSPDKQVSDIDTFISLKVAGIVSWTLDPGAAGAAYKRARSAGIPIADFGSQLNVDSTVYDQRAYGCSMGNRAAAYIRQRVPKGAKVIVIGGPPVPAIINYTNCTVKALKKVGLTVAAKQDNVKDTAATAQPIVQDLLTKHPDTAAIWCYNDPSCLGAGAVVRSSGKTVYMEGKQKGIVVVGANGSKDAADAIKQGVMTATFDPQPPEMGKIAIEALAVHLKNGRPTSAMPKLIVVPMKLWDASNVAKYVPPMKRKVVVGPIPRNWIVKR
jgi:ribose transport system substrate-binding protein